MNYLCLASTVDFSYGPENRRRPSGRRGNVASVSLTYLPLPSTLNLDKSSGSHSHTPTQHGLITRVDFQKTTTDSGSTKFGCLFHELREFGLGPLKIHTLPSDEYIQPLLSHSPRVEFPKCGLDSPFNQATNRSDYFDAAFPRTASMHVGCSKSVTTVVVTECVV